MILKEMEWKDAKDFIEGRLNRLAMCKRGTLQTDINKMYEDLGPTPYYTSEERKVIDEGLFDQIVKKCKVTKTLVKKHKGDSRYIANEIREKINKIKGDAYVHPDLKAHEEKKESLQRQQAEREAQLEGDFRDCLDEFILGSRKIEEFPTVYNELEAKEW